MTILEAVVAVVLGIVAPGGIAAVIIDSRRTRAQVQRVAESVGPVNGHGTVQQQSGRIASEIDSMHTTLLSLVQNTSDLSRRVDGHDREFADHDKRLRHIEVWSQQIRGSNLPAEDTR